MSAILVKIKTCHLHQFTEKTFLFYHRRIAPRQMEIPFWCRTVVLWMKREFLFSHHRTHCNFWQIQNIGMLMIHSGSARKFSSNCILYMVSVTEEFFFGVSHFCQIKTKRLIIDYLNSYSNSWIILVTALMTYWLISKGVQSINFKIEI